MDPLVGKALSEWLLDERVRAMNAGTDPNSNAVALARLINGGVA
jgi:glutamate-1-semialdehyde aminotransferase